MRGQTSGSQRGIVELVRCVGGGGFKQAKEDWAERVCFERDGGVGRRADICSHQLRTVLVKATNVLIISERLKLLTIHERNALFVQASHAAVLVGIASHTAGSWLCTSSGGASACSETELVPDEDVDENTFL